MADRYQNYLSQEYGQKKKSEPYEPTRTKTGKSVYDVQRERVASDAESQKKSYQEALKRRSAARGVSGSGLEEKGQRNLTVELAKARAAGMGEVDVAELQAHEKARETRDARDFMLKERLGQQAFQGEQAEAQREMARGLAGDDLGFREKQLAQQAEQFDDEESFKRFAIGMNMSETAAQRAWQARQDSLGRQQDRYTQQQQLAFQREGLRQNKELTFADLNIQEKEISQQAGQFTNELQFKRWAQQQAINQQTADRIWQANQNNLDRQQKGQLAVADLNMQEKELYLQASQFNDELSFKRWAQQMQVGESTAERVWQANENAMDRQQKGHLTLADLTLKQQELAQQATQFAGELQFKQWSAQAGLDEGESERIWQASQNNLDRQQKGQLYFADLNQREREMAQQATQFTNELQFKEWSTQAGLDDNESNRIWQATQNENDRQATERQMELQRIYQKQSDFDQYGYEKGLAEQQRVFDRDASFDQFRYQNLLQEQELGEKQRQFDVSTGLERDRLSADMQKLETEIQAKKDLLEMERIYGRDAAFDQFRYQNMLQQQELNQKQQQFDTSTGLERDRLAQDIQELQMNIDAKSALSSMEYGQQKGLLHDETIYKQNLAFDQFRYQQEVDNNLARLQEGKMNYQAEIDRQNAVMEANASAWYNIGASGKPMSAAVLSDLQKTDPLAFASYSDARNGVSATDNKYQYELREKWHNALITNMSENLGGTGFQDQIMELMTNLGVDTSTYRRNAGTTQDVYVPSGGSSTGISF